jgi:hypothetical protein
MQMEITDGTHDQIVTDTGDTGLLSLSGPIGGFSYVGGSGLTSSINTSGTFALYEEIVINFASSGSRYSGDLSNETVPEPSTMALAGLGALGVVVYGLRRHKARVPEPDPVNPMARG